MLVVRFTPFDPKPTLIASTRHQKPDIQGTRNHGVCRACGPQGLACHTYSAKRCRLPDRVDIRYAGNQCSKLLRLGTPSLSLTGSWQGVVQGGEAMPTEKSVAEDGSRSIPASPEAEAVIPLGNADKPQTGIPSEPSTPSGHKLTSKRRLIMGAAAVLGLAIAVVFGIPWIKLMLTTVSTDDAYVNGHVTFVAARVPGQVSRVLVDDNNRVHQGDLLVELDPEPYEVIVAVKRAGRTRSDGDPLTHRNLD